MLMKDGTRQIGVAPAVGEEGRLPSAWREFIRFCGELRHGEIERLCIQDGVPVLAEMTRKKVRFSRDP
jgi:hypothetical protein